VVEKHLGAGEHRLDDAGAGRRGGGKLLHELRLHLLVDGSQQLALAAEVVVQRAASDPRPPDDLLGAHAGIAAGGEQLARGADQRRAGRLRALGLGPRPCLLGRAC
jgi:hypothetical protein